MQKILMILTSHRLDCFNLCIDLLVHGGSAARFDRIVILCSGVEGRHLDYVNALPKTFPDIAWDFIYGARGRGKPISDMQNECVRKFPDALYFKLDEDTFVSKDWDLEIVNAYEHYKNDPARSLLTAVVTNNQRGAYHLMTTLPEVGEEFSCRFNKPIITDRMGPVWGLPQCAEFLIRRFLNLDAANEELRAGNRKAMDEGRWPKEGVQKSRTSSQEPVVSTQRAGICEEHAEHRLVHHSSKDDGGALNTEARHPDNETQSTMNDAPYITFSYPFSINCICYDYCHWREIGGVPEEDENGWGKWIPEHRKFVVLVTSALVHHYSFFVQQAWLDRTSLLEDIRRENIPETYRPVAGKAAQFWRIAQQIPGAVARRIRNRP